MSPKAGDQQLIGSILQETYRLERLIGEGGMGAVYEASHLRVRRRFAIKLLYGTIAASDEAVARFRREGEITSELGHPHIIEVIDFNFTPEGAPYIVMELLEGESLSSRLGRGPRMSLDEVAKIVQQIGSALSAAHQRGIIHRDLKPQNIFLCQVLDQTVAKVLDFGISKVLGSHSVVTQTTTILGTPNYMAPEQAEGRAAAADVRTDIFALGAILYEMLACRPAFWGDSVPAILYQVVHQETTPLRAYRPDLPEALDQVVRQAMAKKPEERYASVDEMLLAFAAVRHAGQAPIPAPSIPRTVEQQPREADLPRAATTPGSQMVGSGAPGTESAAAEAPAASSPLLPATAVLEQAFGTGADEVGLDSVEVEGASIEQVDSPSSAPQESSLVTPLTTMSASVGQLDDDEHLDIRSFSPSRLLVLVILAGLSLAVLAVGGVYYWPSKETVQASPTSPEYAPSPKEQPYLAASSPSVRDAANLHPDQYLPVATKKKQLSKPPHSTTAKAPPRTSPSAATKKTPAGHPKQSPGSKREHGHKNQLQAKRLLEVQSSPERALVSINGQKVGLTPLAQQPISSEGSTIQVQLRGFRKWERKIPAGSRPVRVLAKLEPVRQRNVPEPLTGAARLPQGTGRLTVLVWYRGRLEKAEVMLDGRRLGQTPLVREEVPAGAHTLEVSRRRFKTIVEQINIEPHKEIKRKFFLEVVGP